MWLIPSIAVFFSSFLHSKVRNRRYSGRKDYATLVLVVAILEILVAFISARDLSPQSLKVCIGLFVFGYAFIKEGVPRLLYNVSVYRYFIDSEEYSKLAGKNQALNILAGLFGTLLAAILISKGTWKLALVFDALTFLLFGLTLYLFGRDEAVSDNINPDSIIVHPTQFATGLKSILFAMAILSVANCLVWCYLPQLSVAFGVIDLTTSLTLIAVLRLPGMFAGFWFEKISAVIRNEIIVRWLPVLNLLAASSFLAFPSVFTVCLIIIVQGFLGGIYWTADYSIRNRLDHNELVTFNTIALRRLAVFQLITCAVAMFIFRSGLHLKLSLSIGLILLTLLSFTWSMSMSWRGVKALFISFLCLGVFSCTGAFPEKRNVIILPSVSRDLQIRPELTYAALTILNNTSAHLISMSKELTIQPGVMERYSKSDNSQEYVLYLSSSYRSVKGELIDADDVIFSIKTYLTSHRKVAGAFTSIRGAELCRTTDCEIAGLSRVDRNTLKIVLREPDEKFIQKITSPWLVLFKKDRPLFEIKGDCKFPYQTGTAVISNCDSNGIEVTLSQKRFLVTEQEPKFSEMDNVFRIVNDNPGINVSPTLTVLTTYFNPIAKNLSPEGRVKISRRLKAKSIGLAEDLKLRWAPLISSQWLALSAPKDLRDVNIQDTSIHCPPEKIRILLDTSLPNLVLLKKFFSDSIHCPLDFTITEADRYFEDFSKTDIGVAWFTPDYLDLYNIYNPFDCSPEGSCYFNWKDRELEKMLKTLLLSSQRGEANKGISIEIERLIFKKGYAVSLAEMNWWIKGPSGYRPIHTAGLAQISLSDFL
jgi:hypothetical protein